MKKFLSAVLSAVMGISGIGAASVSAEDNGTQQAVQAENKTIAFPGAEGGGMYSEGARSNDKMEVYHVTNLNDSGEGSFRDAVSKSGRFVVFDVSGMIDLESNVTVKSNTTILGQTAPGDGICIRGNNIKLSGSDIIVRYIRFRVGAHLADGTDTRTQDGLEITDNSQRIIVDHCSVSWGTDENLSAYAVKDVTIQNSIIAEALNQSIHSKGEHSYAAIWGGVNLSVHHNIIASHKSRNPKIGTSETVAMTDGYTDDQTLVDIRNNVIYNWGDKAGYGAENGANVNIINNYYKPGPATPENKRARIFEFSAGNKYQKGWSGAVYADGNYVDDDGADAQLVNADNWQIDRGTGVYVSSGVEIYQKLEEPNNTYINEYPITTTSAQEAYNYVIENAGARLPKLDAVDERIISDVVNGTAPSGSKGSVGLVDDPRDTVPEDSKDAYDDRGYPIWETEIRPEDYDTDKDGIPDEWEDRMGLDKENPTDSLFIGPEGYTYLEMFANGAEAGGVSVSVEGDKAIFSASIAQEVDLYIDGEKKTTVELEGELPQDSILISAGYDSNGRISEVKTASTEEGSFPEVSGANVKHFVWNGLDGMEPAGEILRAEVDLSEYKIENGMHTVTAVSQNGNSSMDYLYKLPQILDLEQLDGDFTLVANINSVPTSAKDAYTCIRLGNGGNVYDFGVGSNDSYQKVIYDNGETLDLDDTALIRLEKKDGKITLYRAASLFEWTKVSEYTAGDDSTTLLITNVSPQGQDYAANISLQAINAQTSPQIEITNVEENQRLGFNENIEVYVTPDNANIQQIDISLNGETIVLQNVDISEPQTVTIPVQFEGIDAGELKVSCIDENLCTASDSVNISISADLTPWQIADIGMDENDTKTYVSVTNDYTYKINAPSGRIGGTSDKFGYVYQQFSGDNRIYYRSRMQGGNQFGIMLRASLEADSAMYYFGGEYDGGKLIYRLSHRASAGDETITDYTLDNQNANLYFIAEKDGNTLNIYQTENSSTVYTTKDLVASVDCSTLGDTYYMGFAAVYGGSENNPPDAGWVSLDNNSGDNNYIWNFDYGLDWLWQRQERAVLDAQWSSDEISSNTTGKMVIAPNNDYASNRYIFHEYQMSDELVPEMSADILLSGENPAMNLYFQTGEAQSAYKAVIEDGELKVNDFVICAVETSKWYKINIKEDVGVNGKEAVITVSDENGFIAESPITAVSGADFRTQQNTEKKTDVTKAVYFEPSSSGEGTYYIDNVSVAGNEPSLKITKTESWYSFASLLDQTPPAQLAATTTSNGTELSGETATVYGSESFDVRDTTKTKTFGDVSLVGFIRIDKPEKKITVPVQNGAVITTYASSAKNSETRQIYINEQPYDVTKDTISSYVYEGEDSTIDIYAGAGINLYGISVVRTVISE